MPASASTSGADWVRNVQNRVRPRDVGEHGGGDQARTQPQPGPTFGQHL